VNFLRVLALSYVVDLGPVLWSVPRTCAKHGEGGTRTRTGNAERRKKSERTFKLKSTIGGGVVVTQSIPTDDVSKSREQIVKEVSKQANRVFKIR